MTFKYNIIQLILYFLIIFVFTFLPFVGIIVDSFVWDKYDITGMAYANGWFIIILYSGIFIAFKKIIRLKFEWQDTYLLVNAKYYLKKILNYALFFAIIQFILKGNLIFSGVDRGTVRTSMGFWGPLSTYIGLYGSPTLLSISTVIYCFFSRKTMQEKKYFRNIIVISLFVGLMAGGKANIVTMIFPAILQSASKLNFRRVGLIGILGGLSIIIIGTKQMNMSYADSINYNVYRSTALASFGTVGVWQECRDPSPNASFSLLCGLGENMISYITGVPRHKQEFLKYSLPRDITYKYYANDNVALTGTTNLTITAFGESVFWGGHKYFYIFAIIYSFIFYYITILIFKSRNKSHIRQNILITTFFTAVCIPWLNSTLGSFIGQWFGLTTIIYMVLTWYLISKILSKLKFQKI